MMVGRRCIAQLVTTNINGCLNDEWWLDELKKYVNDDNKLKELLNRKNNDGRTSLHCAACNNNHGNKWDVVERS